jgi:hypothetical protein
MPAIDKRLSLVTILLPTPRSTGVRVHLNHVPLKWLSRTLPALPPNAFFNPIALSLASLSARERTGRFPLFWRITGPMK